MPKFFTIIHTIVTRFFLTLLLLLGIPIVLVMLLLPERYRYQSRLVFWSLNFFYWAVIKVSFVPVSFKGKEHLPQEPVIFVANHQSSVDIPLVGVLARGKPHVWLAKEDLMQGWLLRWVLPRLAVLVDVKSREKAMRSLLNLVRLVKDQTIDVMIFPEGGRFPDDKVHKFYGGFVTLAKMLERSVVPVYISGANKVYPPEAFWINSYPITVEIGKPFMLQKGETDEAFKERVHQWFLEQSEG